MEQDVIYQAAVTRFKELFARATEGPLREPAAMTLATVDADGRPSLRVVLLRGMDERGFVFFTNSLSAKGQQLAANPQAALCFHWDFLGEQVRVEGHTKKVDEEESDNYWELRSRESRLGAWASQQSQLLADRRELESRVEEFEEKFANQDVPRPPHWYGYRVVPERIEFWQEGTNRLHARTIYEEAQTGWKRFSIYP
ncbi:MAG: pyridoxamine 5'-phosphate oxidase [Pirellulales bacterium]|nr:pyridoxamine 5'-phosphate oxidase [Pirellulales bacterium]